MCICALISLWRKTSPWIGSKAEDFQTKLVVTQEALEQETEKFHVLFSKFEALLPLPYVIPDRIEFCYTKCEALPSVLRQGMRSMVTSGRFHIESSNHKPVIKASHASRFLFEFCSLPV